MTAFLLCPQSAERKFFSVFLSSHKASLVAQIVKKLSAMLETQVQSLGWEDPLEKEMAAHSSILAWRMPWTEELDRLQSKELQRVGRDCVTNTSLHFSSYKNINPIELGLHT